MFAYKENTHNFNLINHDFINFQITRPFNSVEGYRQVLNIN